MATNLKAGLGGNFTVTLEDNGVVTTVLGDREEVIETDVMRLHYGEVSFAIERKVAGQPDQFIGCTLPWEHAKALMTQLQKALNA